MFVVKRKTDMKAAFKPPCLRSPDVNLFIPPDVNNFMEGAREIYSNVQSVKKLSINTEEAPVKIESLWILFY